MIDQEKFDLTLKNLNSVGCGFCLAKWTQVTMNLQNGKNNSCHHPVPHEISINEIKKNPSALHNTKYKKILRKQMLEGKRPKECDYCWNVEDNSNEYSDRILKSSDDWSLPFYDEIKISNWREDYYPKYVEVSFSNLCNFKCSYCNPISSSMWLSEIEKYGGYPTKMNFNDLEYIKKSNGLPLNYKEYNPYVEAFWKWWPNLYKELHTFRITGGEPLIIKETWEILDYIINIKQPNKELSLSINTNLGVSDDLIDKLIEKINIITENEKVKDLIIYTSVDGWGEKAEYMRFGLNFNKFWDNIVKILDKCSKVSIGLMSTYNALSVSSFDKLIEEVYFLKCEFLDLNRPWMNPISLDTSYLRYPEHQTVKILTENFNNTVKNHINFIDDLPPVMNVQVGNFQSLYSSWYTDTERIKIKRIYDWMISPYEDKEKNIDRKDFYNFFNEHDRRRGTNFCKTFPELEDFFNYCKEIVIL